MTTMKEESKVLQELMAFRVYKWSTEVAFLSHS